MEVKTVFANAHVWVVDKPAGVLAVPSRLGTADPRPCLRHQLEALRGGPVWPVHRLDFEVSGLVIFALQAEAHRLLNQAFEKRRVQKHYQAWSELKTDPPQLNTEIIWKTRLKRGKKRTYPHPKGLDALTRAWPRRMQTQAPGVSHLLWDLYPETGRSHQLRVHLAGHGFPIVGDVLYGAQAHASETGISLRAIAVEFLDSEICTLLELPQSFTVERSERLIL